MRSRFSRRSTWPQRPRWTWIALNAQKASFARAALKKCFDFIWHWQPLPENLSGMVRHWDYVHECTYISWSNYLNLSLQTFTYIFTPFHNVCTHVTQCTYVGTYVYVTYNITHKLQNVVYIEWSAFIKWYRFSWRAPWPCNSRIPWLSCWSFKSSRPVFAWDSPIALGSSWACVP
jgi:hypothetical protein